MHDKVTSRAIVNAEGLTNDESLIKGSRDCSDYFFLRPFIKSLISSLFIFSSICIRQTHRHIISSSSPAHCECSSGVHYQGVRSMIHSFTHSFFYGRRDQRSAKSGAGFNRVPALVWLLCYNGHEELVDM